MAGGFDRLAAPLPASSDERSRVRLPNPQAVTPAGAGTSTTPSVSVTAAITAIGHSSRPEQGQPRPFQIDPVHDFDRIAQRVDQRDILQGSCGMLLMGVVKPDSRMNGIITTNE